MSVPTVALTASHRTAKPRCFNCGGGFDQYPHWDTYPDVAVYKPCHEGGRYFPGRRDPLCSACLAETWAETLRMNLRALRVLVHKLRATSTTIEVIATIKAESRFGPKTISAASAIFLTPRAG